MMKYTIEVSRTVWDHGCNSHIEVRRDINNPAFIEVREDGTYRHFGIITLPAEMARLLGQALIDAADEATE